MFKDKNAGEALCASFPQPVEGIGDRATFWQAEPVDGFFPMGFLCVVAGDAIVTVGIYRFGQLIPMDEHVKLTRKVLGRLEHVG